MSQDHEDERIGTVYALSELISGQAKICYQVQNDNIEIYRKKHRESSHDT